MSLSTYFYDPFHEPFFTASDFNHMFDAAWNARNTNTNTNRDVQRDEGSGAMSAAAVRPRMDLHESKDKNEMTATFELPGMKKEDVSIDVQNDRLVVSGQSTQTGELNGEGYAVRERKFGRFSRTVPLPAGTKHEDIKAQMDNGVLTVTFPRTQPEQAAKKITIS